MHEMRAGSWRVRLAGFAAVFATYVIASGGFLWGIGPSRGSRGLVALLGVTIAFVALVCGLLAVQFERFRLAGGIAVAASLGTLLGIWLALPVRELDEWLSLFDQLR